MKKLSLALIILTATPLPHAFAKPAVSARTQHPRGAVLLATQQHFQRNYKHLGTVKVTVLDVSREWALARAEAVKKDLDPSTVLLRRRGGRWGVIVLGSSLHGTGKQFGVPRALWKKWNL